MEENAKTTQTRVPSGQKQASPAFNRRGVSHNTRPRANQEIERRDYDRSVELFSRVLGR